MKITRHIGLKEKKNGRIVKNWEMELSEFFIKNFKTLPVKEIKKPLFISRKKWNDTLENIYNIAYNMTTLEVEVKMEDIIKNDNIHTTKLKKRK
jgi:hypothetical protein